MTVFNSYSNISPEDSLNYENISQIKPEYSQGEVDFLEDKSEAHDTIVVNAIALLKPHIRSIGYRIHTGSIRVNIDTQSNIFYCPDLMVSIPMQNENYYYFKRQPHLIVEVTSAETAVFDRGEKFAEYRKLETLQEYVLISENRVNVECFRKNGEGEWLYYSYRQGEEIYLASIDFRTPISALYEDVTISSSPRYTCEPKNYSENYLKFSHPTTLFAPESPIQLELPTPLPVTKLQNFNQLKPHILVGLGTAIILGFAGSQIYRFWPNPLLGKPNKPSPAAPEDVTVNSSINERTESTKIIDESQKEREKENNFNFQIERVGESGAKKAIGLINRMQKGFFSENERFASNWQDLGIQVKSKKGEYDYKIIWSDEIKTIVTATANKPGLKSYTGVVIVQGQSAMDKICETNESSNTPPVIDEINVKIFECPSGYSSVAAAF